MVLNGGSDWSASKIRGAKTTVQLHVICFCAQTYGDSLLRQLGVQRCKIQRSWHKYLPPSAYHQGAMVQLTKGKSYPKESGFMACACVVSSRVPNALVTGEVRCKLFSWFRAKRSLKTLHSSASARNFLAEWLVPLCPKWLYNHCMGV